MNSSSISQSRGDGLRPKTSDAEPSAADVANNIMRNLNTVTPDGGLPNIVMMHASDLRVLVGSHDALVATFLASLLRVDAANSACPVNTSKKGVEKCPKCGATHRDSCGPAISALAALEATARAAIQKATGQ